MPILDHYPAAAKPTRFNPARYQADEIKIVPAFHSEGLAGYLRTGGCTAGCGACCEAFVVPVKPEALGDAEFEPVSAGQIMIPVDPAVRGQAGYEDWEYWLALHEAWLLQMPGGLLVLPIPIQAKTPAPAPLTLGGWTDWLEGYGISLIRRLGQQLLAYVPVGCTKLTEEGLCGVFGTPARPQMCSPYPEHPMDIEGIDFCTYRFDPVSTQQIMVASRTQSIPLRKKKRKKKGRR